MKNNRCYALKEKDPFNGTVIDGLRKMPGGDSLALVYLKIYILSKEKKLSEVFFEGASITMLSDAIGENAETVRMVSSYLFSIGEIYLSDEEIEEEKESKDKEKRSVITREDINEIVNAWNKCGADPIMRIVKTSTRYKMLVRRIKEYGKDAILAAIKNVSTSDFLLGKNDSEWRITFDWFVRPNNFPKVYEGKYNKNRGFGQQQNKFSSLPDNIRVDMENRGVIRDGTINYAKMSDSDAEILRSAGVKV